MTVDNMWQEWLTITVHSKHLDPARLENVRTHVNAQGILLVMHGAKAIVYNARAWQSFEGTAKV